MSKEFKERQIGFVGICGGGQPVRKGPFQQGFRMSEHFQQQECRDRLSCASPRHESVSGQGAPGGCITEAGIEQWDAIDGHIDLQSRVQAAGNSLLECSDDAGKSLKLAGHGPDVC
jgi:hypothetical protein